MGIAGSMKDLTDHIITSHNVRIKALGDLVLDTKKTLQDFTQERQNMGRRQGKDLLDFVSGLSKGVDDTLKGFHKSHKRMSDEQAKNLENFAKNLANNTEKMLKQVMKNRKHMSAEQAKNLRGFAANLTKDVTGMLKDFQKDHQQMGDEQAKNLADFVNDLTRDVGSMMNGFTKTRGEMSADLKSKLAGDVKNIETYVKNKLREFEESHGKMSDALRKSLTGYVNGIVKEVGRLLQGYNADMKQARSAWENISSTLTGSRAETYAPSVKFAGKVTTVEEAIGKEEPEVGEAPHDADIEEKVFGYINAHPEGAKVGDMEPVFGIPRMRLGLVAKKLLEEGKVRKDGNVYYPM